jgi:hypothetical protein
MIPRQLGDLTVFNDQPAKMWKALAAIAARAHPAYDECSGFAPGTSHDKCLFMSLAVRDFLVRIGFGDATVRGCFLWINADDLQGKLIWSVGIGAPDQAPEPGKLNGHVVCTVPSRKLLIDTTAYQAIRPHWSETVTGMAAIEYHAPCQDQVAYGRPSIAGAEIELPDRRVMMMWLDRPELQWKRSEDFRVRSQRRRDVTEAMVQAFGEWAD